MDNAEEVFYNEDGAFTPLTDSSLGNTDKELAYARNTFMESEKERFLKLLKNEKVLSTFLKLLDLDSEHLLREAQELQDKLEYGEIETHEEKEMMKLMTPEEREAFHLKKLTQVEGLLILLNGAARDKALLLELVKSLDEDKDTSYDKKTDIYSRSK